MLLRSADGLPSGTGGSVAGVLLSGDAPGKRMRNDLAHEIEQGALPDRRVDGHETGTGGRAAAFDPRHAHAQFQRKMRKNVHRPRPARRQDSRAARREAERPPLSRCSLKSARHSVVGTSVMPPSSPFSGRVRTSTCVPPRTSTERRATAPCALHLRRLARKRLHVAARARSAIVIERAERTGRLLRRADCRAEIHQRLCDIARARFQK